MDEHKIKEIVEEMVQASKRCSIYGSCLRVMCNIEAEELAYEEHADPVFLRDSAPWITLFFVTEPTTYRQLAERIVWTLFILKQ